MSPSFLIVGATGNTGKGVVQTLPALLTSTKFASYRTIALTRDLNSSSAKELAKLEKIEWIEKDWKMVDADWLRENEVERIFIASHNGVSHFTDETLFLNYALEAGVKYIVRISTTKNNIAPNTPVFYARAHWAIENMLEQPEFEAMHWTSLQPNVFISYTVGPVIGWLKEYRETGKKTPLKLMIDGDSPLAAVDPAEVGVIAAHLLVQENTKPHSTKKYCIVGAEDLSGKEAVELLEKYAGTSVDDVSYRDVSWAEQMKAAGTPENVIASLRLAPRSGYNGDCSLEKSPTSREVVKLYAPKKGAYSELETALKAV